MKDFLEITLYELKTLVRTKTKPPIFTNITLLYVLQYQWWCY